MAAWWPVWPGARPADEHAEEPDLGFLPVRGRVRPLAYRFFSGSVRDALAACLPSQEAFELSSLGHSVLTYTRLRPEAGVLPAYSESPTEVAALPGLATLAVALAGAMAIGDVRQAGTAPTDSAMLLDAAPLMMAGVLIIELLAVVALLCDLGVATRGSRPPHPPTGSCAVGYDGLWCRPPDR